MTVRCTCTGGTFPPQVDIAPGLPTLPRRIGGFPEIRSALLASIADPRFVVPLSHWAAREGTDLGLMLLDMWAYLADILAFYDEVYAQEAYLRTATQRESLRRLTDLLAYRPLPAVSASVDLVLRADGKRAVTLPAGTAFRSGPVDGKPQVFELDAPVVIHPLRNTWAVTAPVAHTLSELTTTTELLFEAARSARFEVGELVEVRANGVSAVRRVTLVGEFPTNGERFRQVTLDADLSPFPGDTALADIRLYRPTQTAPVHPEEGIGGTSVALHGVYRGIRPGQTILIEPSGEEPSAVVVASNNEGTVDTAVTTDTTVGLAKIPYTALTILSSTDTFDAATTTVHYGLVFAGTPVALPSDVLAPTDVLALAGPLRVPQDDPGSTRFVVVDDDEQATVFEGTLDWLAPTVTPNPDSETRPEMILPAVVHGNVATATRGESVLDEALGTGDASLANVSFTLKKSPLTYVTDATSDSGLATTLSVAVDGILWNEEGSFYGAGPDAQIYVVRLDEDGAATITFGDGVRGARLPTGAPVVATYRYGAGASAPEAGSISQIAKPTPGLVAVRQPRDADPGADAESADSIRKLAPRQAMFLGRAVSILDYEAVAAAYPGVVAAQAGWAWEGTRQTCVVEVWYIGGVSLAGALLARLQGVSDPTTLFEVRAAEPVGIVLALDVEIEDSVKSDVAAEIAALLGDPDEGLLHPARIGIGRRLSFSALRAKVHEVPGVVSVRIDWRKLDASAPATGTSVSPGPGRYFDLVDTGTFSINGTTYALS